MKKLFLIVILCLISIIASGCDNSIYYYEKEDAQISNEKISNSDNLENENNLEEEPFYKVFDESIDLDTNKKNGIYIGKGKDNKGKDYIKIKCITEDKELWSYQTPSFFITDTFNTSSVDIYYSFYSPFYGYDYNENEQHEYYNFYIKENNIIKLFNIKNGEIIWTSDELDITPTSIIETADHLYAVNNENPYVYVIDINNGKLINKIKINNSGYYFIKEIKNNRLMIQTHYQEPIIEEINLDQYSNIKTGYVRVLQSFFEL